MSRPTVRRTGAFLSSAGLLASLMVVAIAAPGGAVKCTALADYGTPPIDIQAGDVVCGTDGPDEVRFIDGKFNGLGGDDVASGVRGGTFNGGAGNDWTDYVNEGGTFNGGAGNDWGGDVISQTYPDVIDSTFNGGTGDDCAWWVYQGAVINGGPGDDVVEHLQDGGTFAGGAGADRYGDPAGDYDVWSATLDQNVACPWN